MTLQQQIEEMLERNLTHYDDGEFGDDHYDMIMITCADVLALFKEATDEVIGVDDITDGAFADINELAKSLNELKNEQRARRDEMV